MECGFTHVLLVVFGHPFFYPVRINPASPQPVINQTGALWRDNLYYGVITKQWNRQKKGPRNEKNLFHQIFELQQYGRRSMVRVPSTTETQDEDTAAPKSWDYPIHQDNLVYFHWVEDSANRTSLDYCRQTQTRLPKIQLKTILRLMTVDDDLTKYRDKRLCQKRQIKTYVIHREFRPVWFLLGIKRGKVLWTSTFNFKAVDVELLLDTDSVDLTEISGTRMTTTFPLLQSRIPPYQAFSLEAGLWHQCYKKGENATIWSHGLWTFTTQPSYHTPAFEPVWPPQVVMIDITILSRIGHIN